MKTFFLGGGCFWCLDSAYQQLKGVIDVVVGYQGGTAQNANYEAVCSGTTGHAEVAKVIFDETQISEAIILDAFFTMHDPTQLNRQGHDVGTQYRSVMFFQDENQRAAFDAAIERASQIWGPNIVTSVEPAPQFFEAEQYHQNFFEKNPFQGYCNAVVLPKVIKVRERFANFLK